MYSNSAWNEYAKEFNKNSTFDMNRIHTGLGLKGIEPNQIVQKAQKILDVGCGDGINTFLLHSVNNAYTRGIDIAASSIEDAKAKYGAIGCEFINADFFSYCKSAENENYDLITFFGSIDYIEINDCFLHSLNSISKLSTRCYISKFHPMWTSLFGNDTDEQQVQPYFENGRIDQVPYGRNHQYLLNRFHYSLSYIVELFSKNGWKLNKLQEPCPCISDSSFEYLNYSTDEVLMDRLSNIPMTVIFEFERIE